MLFDAYYRPLVLWADTFLQDMTQAEDLVQEFFVKLWEKKIAESLLPATLRPYLFASVKNMSLNALGRKDPLKRPHAVARLDRAWVEYDDLTETMIQEIEGEIEQLPARTKEVVKAIYIEGLRYKEVAERYAISVSTVKTLLVGAIKRLRDKIGNARNKLFLFFYKFSRH